MNHDIDIKKVRINCFRQSKVAGEFMLQMRVPGAMIEARHLSMVQELCERYGNGTFHMGTRQTLDVPGIKYENIEAVNKFLKGYIHDVDVEMCDVDMEVNDYGYPTIGARNVMSCIGNAHCIISIHTSWPGKLRRSYFRPITTSRWQWPDVPMTVLRPTSMTLASWA